LKLALKFSDEKLAALQLEMATISAEVKTKSKFLEEREASVSLREERVRTEPPKLLDASLKTQRDQAYLQLRQNKLENVKLKEDILELSKKIGLAEAAVGELIREKERLLETQKELKQTLEVAFREKNSSPA